MSKLNLIPMTVENRVEYVVDSREVAEMLGKEHWMLLRDIEGSKDGKTVGIIPTLRNNELGVSKYFLKSTYKSGKGTYRNYLITKMGCELLGNKQQGEKGILFTATYVQVFNDMEQTLKGNMTLDSMLGSLQEFKAIQSDIESMGRKLEDFKYSSEILFDDISEIHEERDSMRENIENSNRMSTEAYLLAKSMKEEADEKLEYLKSVYEVVNDPRWKERTETVLKSTAYTLGDIDYIKNLRRKVYELMERRLKVSFDNRINRRRKTMALEGVCKTKRNKVNPLTIISAELPLIDSYVSTVKEVCIAFMNGIYVVED